MTFEQPHQSTDLPTPTETPRQTDESAASFVPGSDAAYAVTPIAVSGESAVNAVPEVYEAPSAEAVGAPEVMPTSEQPEAATTAETTRDTTRPYFLIEPRVYSYRPDLPPVTDVPPYRFTGSSEGFDVPADKLQGHLEDIAHRLWLPGETHKTDEELDAFNRITNGYVKLSKHVGAFINDRLPYDTGAIHMFDDRAAYEAVAVSMGADAAFAARTNGFNTPIGMVALRDEDFASTMKVPAHELGHRIQLQTARYDQNATDRSLPHIDAAYADTSGPVHTGLGATESAAEMTNTRVLAEVKLSPIHCSYTEMGAIMSGAIVAASEEYGVAPEEIERQFIHGAWTGSTDGMDKIRSTVAKGGQDNLARFDQLTGVESVEEMIDVAKQLKLPGDAGIELGRMQRGEPYHLYGWRNWGEIH